MDTPEERPKTETGKPSIHNIEELVDQQAKEGKISATQAFQLKMWNSVKPDENASSAKWEAWKKAKPDIDIPDLFTKQ